MQWRRCARLLGFAVFRAANDGLRHSGEEQLVDWIEKVPVYEAEEAVWLEERRLHQERAPSGHVGRLELEPCATWNLHFSAEAN